MLRSRPDSIVFHATLALVAGVFALACSFLVPGILLIILAYALSTVWISMAHEQALMSGRMLPRWLDRLERLRQYLASESDSRGQKQADRAL
jgi:hypothetical protein